MRRHLVALLVAIGLPCIAEAAPESFVDIDGGRIAYESCTPNDAAQTIVLIHDGTLDSEVWNGVWPIFCKTFHTVRFDLRGYGNSPRATAPYSSIDDIGLVMNALHIPRATLIGSSANGGRAMAFALKHPEAVQNLIVSGPAIPGVRPSNAFIKLAIPFSACMTKNDTPCAIAVVEKLPHLVAAKNTAAKQEAMRLIKAHPQDLEIRPLEKPVESIVDRLGDLKMPTLVLIGDSDHANNVDTARIAHEKIPGSVLVTIKEAGHLSYLEHPQEFADIVMNFLKTAAR